MVPLGFAQFQNGLWPNDARVVDEDIHGAHFSFNLVEQRPDLAAVLHPGADGDAAPAQRPHLSGGFHRVGLRCGHTGNIRPLPGEHEADRLADAPAGSCHNSNFSIQAHDRSGGIPGYSPVNLASRFSKNASMASL